MMHASNNQYYTNVSECDDSIRYNAASDHTDTDRDIARPFYTFTLSSLYQFYPMEQCSEYSRHILRRLCIFY